MAMHRQVLTVDAHAALSTVMQRLGYHNSEQASEKCTVYVIASISFSHPQRNDDAASEDVTSLPSSARTHPLDAIYM